MPHDHAEGAFEHGVMVDVGPGAGALVIYTDETMRGEEIEIGPAGTDSPRSHTEVLRRRVARGHVDAAVFGSLAEGDYELWHRTRQKPVPVRIRGGEVTELDWR